MPQSSKERAYLILVPLFLSIFNMLHPPKTFVESKKEEKDSIGSQPNSSNLLKQDPKPAANVFLAISKIVKNRPWNVTEIEIKGCL